MNAKKLESLIYSVLFSLTNLWTKGLIFIGINKFIKKSA